MAVTEILGCHAGTADLDGGARRARGDPAAPVGARVGGTHLRACPADRAGAGARVTIEGADGRRYLDCLSGAGTLALGHNHPVVLEAIRKVLDSGAPLHVLDLATPVKDTFITELFRTLPPGLAGPRACSSADRPVPTRWRPRSSSSGPRRDGPESSPSAAPTTG